jgi:DNA-directed RNA polymerase specialized sigma24 family protein
MELMGYFEQMSNYFASKFGIKPSDREDIKQEVMIVAFKALDKYVKTKSNPFSYFYKVFHTAFMYHLRKQKMKKDHRPVTCSIEVFKDIKGQEDIFEDRRYEDQLVSIGGHTFDKTEVAEKLASALKFVKRVIKTENIKDQKKMIMMHPDNFVRDLGLRYLEKHRKRCNL